MSLFSTCLKNWKRVQNLFYYVIKFYICSVIFHCFLEVAKHLFSCSSLCLKIYGIFWNFVRESSPAWLWKSGKKQGVLFHLFLIVNPMTLILAFFGYFEFTLFKRKGDLCHFKFTLKPMKCTGIVLEFFFSKVQLATM